MSRPPIDPDEARSVSDQALSEEALAERALFEAAIAELERDQGAMLLRKAGVPPARKRRGGEPPAVASRSRRAPSPESGRAPSSAPARLGRRLRAGEEVALRVDLHGLERAAALGALARFVREAPSGALALVIHGKGQGILARAVREALDRSPRVAEHVEAPVRLGGRGARVIRLRTR